MNEILRKKNIIVFPKLQQRKPRNGSIDSVKEEIPIKEYPTHLVSTSPKESATAEGVNAWVLFIARSMVGT